MISTRPSSILKQSSSFNSSSSPGAVMPVERPTVPLAETTAAERHAANADTPVFLAHGRRDGIVPLARGAAGRDLLQGLGQPVQWQDYPMEHSVCIEEVQALNAWLLQVWGAA